MADSQIGTRFGTPENATPKNKGIGIGESPGFTNANPLEPSRRRAPTKPR